MKYRVEMQMKDRKYAWTDKDEFVDCVAELKVFLKGNKDSESIKRWTWL